MSDTVDEAREGALDRAAQAMAADPGGEHSAVGDPGSFLRAYYRHVAAEDVATFGGERLAAVAAAHAALGAERPQGRALVQVTDADQTAAIAAFGPVRTVIDIVTDDMPFLVDSVTMELNRHEADISLFLHPRLVVRRTVTGDLQEVVGPVNGTNGTAADSDSAPGEITESWMHIELAGLGDRVPLSDLEADLCRVLDDVRVTIEDQPKMTAAAASLALNLEGATGAPLPGRTGPQPVISATDAGQPGADSEAGELLRWLADGHFIFLGYREYDLVPGDDGMNLRAVAGTGLGFLRHDREGSDSFASLPADVRAKAAEPDRLVLAKGNSRSTVYRNKYLDYVAVKKVGANGQVTGEWRFLGLYTHSAYTESVARIPVLRRQLTDVLAAAAVTPDSHDGHDLIEILEDYPREELFQISTPQLTEIATAVLRLRERKQTRLFLRRDVYGRYMSCLVFLPRDRYTTAVRLRVQEILRSALDGDSVDYSAQVGESALARLHVVVRGRRGQPLPGVDAAALERRIAAAVRSWDEDLEEEALRVLGGDRARQLLDRTAAAIPETYKTGVSAAEAVDDLSHVLSLRESGDTFAVQLREDETPAGGHWRLRVYRTGAPVILSDVLPQLQHMGLEVVDEHPYEFASSEPFYIYDFGLRVQSSSARQRPRSDSGREQFEQALCALWRGETEDDGFNALVLEGGLSWREVMVLRAYAKYLLQAGTQFSQGYIQRVLCGNPTVARLLTRLFESRFDPAHEGGEAERSEALVEEIRGELDDVVSLDADRILRSYLALIRATLRTNYYRTTIQPAPGAATRSPLGQLSCTPTHAPYLVVKLDPGEVPGLPEPRPKFEIFVYAPRLEAVHLRFGRVARGGLRWSDRLEDFRTEILGLVKAQEVKNSVIVPSGAKGGFVCKQLPDPADREAYQGEVLACYRMFITAMLDITDNMEGERVTPPRDVVRHDGDDPYLVVAADKGTATFSDEANEIAAGYGFWLGDAFASGGSVGYDHKKMGITARGAWESVKNHFATLGLNPATDEFTVAGVGDMSGDVFGNGMLLSDKLRLVAAFDHRHIFVDPDPDPAVSFAERQRLFALARSSWTDYDRTLISAGGGVWPRSAKSIPLSSQAHAVLGIDEGTLALAPDELISAILTAPVDLLWNGGIGTYVKASFETQESCGDRSNDSVRVNGDQLRARVVAEGGNLGLTQAGRIEFAVGGGLVDTDFIDNSAGVDTSDHEVNIKILLDRAVRDGEITTATRNELLQQMTDEVAALVLQHNYAQNMTLATARAQGPQMLHVHARYLRQLERENRLRRGQDAVPGDKEIAERRSAGKGLTNPELALLLALTKISAAEEVLASGLADDPYLNRELTEYFPAPLRATQPNRMRTHPLRHEIITTSVVNEMVDTSGTTFIFRLNEETGASVPDITRAWLVAREVFGLREFWRQVTELDGTVDIGTQIALLLEGRKLIERACRWLLYNRRPPIDITAAVDHFSSGVLAVRSGLPKLLTGRDAETFEQRRDAYVGRGVPPELAETVAGMVPTYSAFDIVETAAAASRGVEETAEVYFDLAERLQIARLRDRIIALPREDRWSSMARAALRDDLYAAHAAMTLDVLSVGGLGTPEERLAAWTERNGAAVGRATRTLGEIWETERFTFTTLSVALRAVRALVTSSALPHQS
ncbi:MAG: NAD-glutamate dehydrogenase [Actinobacteria bacterium]|nr:NAD-glutamate dehydrogenase [Actinomycetota bacterium]